MNQDQSSNAAFEEIDLGSIDLGRKDAFRLKSLEFENGGRRYDMRFNRTRIAQLRGDSSTGKTLFATDLREQRKSIPAFPSILVIGSVNSEALDLLKDLDDLPYDLVVIDNADILLDKQLDRAISRSLLTSGRTYWIIIGRKWFDCCAYSGCRGILQSEKLRGNAYRFTIRYTDMLSD